MGFVEKKGLRYYQLEIFRGHAIFHAILTRRGGVSAPPYDSLNTGGTVGDNKDAVLENHKRIYQIFGYSFESRFDVWQVHGANVLCTDVPRPAGTPHPKADGILTDKPEVTLFMRFADCVPVLLFDPRKRVIGIYHAGWQGTAKRIANAAIKQMTQCYGSKPDDILAGLGPSICQDCYQVGSDVYHVFLDQFGSQADDFFYQGNGNFFLDLWAANEFSLREAGVHQIELAGICTACHLDDWYSHRAEGGITGRFGVLMSLKTNSAEVS